MSVVQFFANGVSLGTDTTFPYTAYWSPTANGTFALTAVALAGVALTGGRGSLPRVLVGALILATISNGLTIRGIQPYWATATTGALLIASLFIERIIQRSLSERLMAANLSVHTKA